ncbi:MAG: histone deacetylase [Methanoregula sp.]|uniref:histone deacetylase family protein n=1 Tax=Methanoregula sp. TaxID=2052170 RepID=UPI003BAFC07A
MKCSVITGPVYDRHDCPGHPESAQRLHTIAAHLPAGIPVLDPVAATAEDLGRVHKAGYLSWLRSLSPFPVTGTTKDPDLAAIQWFIDADTYITPWSYDVATYAAGAACRAADRARDGESCFAFVRPPGHHALPGWAMGFCIINNVAVAAARALDSVDKVAIIDWDLHHGNGTQEIFVKSDRVVYCSVHAEGLFPYSGAAVEIGTGPGAGYTVNAPLMPGSTIGDVAHVFTDLFFPVLERVHPDLILVSAGQDMLFDDPLSVMGLVPEDYGTLTSLLLDATGLSPAFVLEGGYGPGNPAAINAILESVDGRRFTDPLPEPSATTRARVRMFRKLHGITNDRAR